MAQIYLSLAFALTFPGLWVKFAGVQISHGLTAFLFGLAILGAAFLLSWAAEVAQKDISQALAVAFLALVAVLPEYAVDFVFAWQAPHVPGAASLATANMTGANRLLVGVGWTAVVVLYALRFRKVGVKLERAHRTEVLFLGLATCYSIVIPLKGRIDLFDCAVLVTIFAAYTWRISKAEAHEPELLGPAKLIGELQPVLRRLGAVSLFLYAGWIIFVSAHPFAHSLVEAGKERGFNEFLLVQWVAPLASEAPEFIIALIWTFRGDAEAGLSALISSKVNQWTLLVGTLPLVYSISAGRIAYMPLDEVQVHELWLTAAQSLFAVAILANLSLSWYGAVSLFVLFAAQLIFPDIRMPLSYLYVALAVLLVIRDRKSYPLLIREGFLGHQTRG